MPEVFVSHVRAYCGPGVVEALLDAGHHVVGHDRSFVDAKARAAAEREGITPLAGQSPEDIAAALDDLSVTRFVFNDAHPNEPKPLERIAVEELRSAHEALVEFPFRLAQRIVPALKRQQAGSIVFLTSARQLQPEPGFAVATSVRAGATALALAVAREVAPYGVQVNAVQPNYLYSEMYYPRAEFVDDPAGRARIAELVPAGRLGEPRELGALVEFLVSGRSAFVTGQVINFTGGWP